MKILILINIGDTLYKFRRELINALLKRGDEVYISSAMSPKLDYFTDLGCKLIKTPLEQHGVNPFHDLKLLFFYKKTIKKLQPDYVLSFTQKPNIYGGYICGKLKIPFLPTITGLGTGVYYSGPLIRFIVFTLYRFALKKSPLVFIQNKGCFHLLQKKRVVKNNVRIIPGSGINLQRFQYEDYPDESLPIRLLYIGRMLADKGINEYFQCIEIIKRKYPQVVFEFLGEDDDHFKEAVHRLVLKKMLTVYPRTDEVRPFLKECSAIINPSYHEGMSNVLLESSATGRPVLASRIPGCQETFDEGVTGFGFEPKNVDDLCRVIERFIQLPYSQKAEMGRKARKKMEREFDRSQVIQAYIDIIGQEL